MADAKHCLLTGTEALRGEDSLADPGMFGSRGAHVTCSAARVAARELRNAILASAATRLGVEKTKVDIDPSWNFANGAGERTSLSELGDFDSIGTYSTNDIALTYGAQAVDLTVDEATGSVTVHRIASIHDVGVVVNRDTAHAQIEGGVIQAIGAALSEQLTFGDDGIGLQTGFLSHLLPTLKGLPHVDVHFVEELEAFELGTGAKGLGEAPMMGIPAAVANAIAAATGHRPRAYPMTPESLLRILSE